MKVSLEAAPTELKAFPPAEELPCWNTPAGLVVDPVAEDDDSEDDDEEEEDDDDAEIEIVTTPEVDDEEFDEDDFDDDFDDDFEQDLDENEFMDFDEDEHLIDGKDDNDKKADFSGDVEP
ncbi:MAG: hypothetical protein SGJ19_00435 [Planctomycetia bacterium]|nr:hypothetical protein [Planctomycetia bacterium]